MLRKDKLNLYLSSFALYISISIGSFGLWDKVYLKALIMSFPFILVILILFVYRSKIDLYLEINLFIFAFLFIIGIIVSLMNNSLSIFTLKKIEGGFISSLISIIILHFILKKYRLTSFVQAYINVTLLMLIVTVVYKIVKNGLWDRNVMFFINGPITFAWMMGIGALSAVSTVHFNINDFKKMLFLALVHIIAVLWTESKGPIIALILALIYLSITKMNAKSLFVLILFSFVVFWIIYFNDVIFDRFNITSIYGTQIENPTGSISIRYDMWRESLNFVENNIPILGYGLGSWSKTVGNFYFQNYGFHYPHNIIIELLVEYGILGTLLWIIFLFYVFVRSNFLGRVLFVFSFVSLQFSGDLSYINYLIVFPIGLTKKY